MKPKELKTKISHADPLTLSLSVCVCSGVTGGTVITVAVTDAAPGRWQKMKEQQAKQFAEYFFRFGVEIMFHGHSRVEYGQQYTCKQCFIKSLELDDQNAEAWLMLSGERGGSVGGQQYTKQQCEVKYNECPKAMH